jgi:hypothetical protein
MNEVVFNNPYTCTQVSKLKDELIELIKIGSPSNEVNIPTLLSEIYRVIEPEFKDPVGFFKSWVDKLRTISEENVEEQSLFLKLIRYICEVGDYASFEFQKIIVKLLLEDNDFPIITMLEENGELYF